VATSPDGRVWEISVRRVRLPQWRANYDPSDDDAGDLVSLVFVRLVVAPFMWIVVPMLRVIAELPIALLRPLISPVRWVEAETHSTSTIQILWQTTRDEAGSVAAEIAERLQHGYENLTPSGAQLVSMSEPPGFSDLEQ
jgi:hypothetical protein